MRLFRPPDATAAVFLALTSTASALCVLPEIEWRVDTLDRAAPVLAITTHHYYRVASDGTLPRQVITGNDTLSPARILADLMRERDLHQDAYIGRVVGVRNEVLMHPDGWSIGRGPGDTVVIEVEAVLKGNLSPGTHRYIDTVKNMGGRFTELAERRMIWFRGWAGTGQPPRNRRLDGTVAPTGYCDSIISGHHVLPDGRVTLGGLYEQFGVGVPLATVLQAFNGVAIRRTEGRTGSDENGPARFRGGRLPIVLFKGGIPGLRGSAVSVDGRRHLPGPLAP